jgi:hypothetical protein
MGAKSVIAITPYLQTYQKLIRSIDISSPIASITSTNQPSSRQISEVRTFQQSPFLELIIFPSAGGCRELLAAVPGESHY